MTTAQLSDSSALRHQGILPWTRTSPAYGNFISPRLMTAVTRGSRSMLLLTTLYRSARSVMPGLPALLRETCSTLTGSTLMRKDGDCLGLPMAASTAPTVQLQQTQTRLRE